MIERQCAYVDPKTERTCLRTREEHNDQAHTFSRHWLGVAGDHDLNCSCGWWADGPERMLGGYARQHIAATVA